MSGTRSKLVISTLFFSLFALSPCSNAGKKIPGLKTSKSTVSDKEFSGIFSRLKNEKNSQVPANSKTSTEDSRGLFGIFKKQEKPIKKEDDVPEMELPTGKPKTSRETVENPPYNHAMVFIGGSLDIYAFFGMYDAAMAKFKKGEGPKPDLIIGTCGGALASAIIKILPDPEERRAFIRSKQFYDYMRNIRFTDIPLTGIIKDLKKVAHLAVEQKDPDSPHRVIPDPFYKRSLLHKDNQYYFDELTTSFENSDPNNPEVVILSNEILFDESEVGRKPEKGEKLYRETVYTSNEVARNLAAAGYKRSATAKANPDSFIDDRVNINTRETVTQAARNSFTDPYLIHVDKPFLTGAVSSQSAFDIAKLAKEVTVRYPPHWDKIDGGIMGKFFGYDPWEATEDFTSNFADRWVDTSNPPYKSLAQKLAFAPTPKAMTNLGLRATSNVPKFSHDNFLKHIEEQYAYGWENYMESSQLPKNDKTHIERRIDRGLAPAEFRAMQLEARGIKAKGLKPSK